MSESSTGRPPRMFDIDEYRTLGTSPWRSAQLFMSDELQYIHRFYPEPDIAESLNERLEKVNALFLLDNLESAGVLSLRDLTYWACLVTQPDYLLITQEAIGLDSGVELEPNFQTNVAAWTELMYVLRLEESERCWPGTKVFSQQTLIRQKYASIAQELYQRLEDDYSQWGALSPRVRRRCISRRLQLNRWG